MIVPHLDVLTVNTQTLQDLLEKGSIKSTHLVNFYLDQIQRHDDYLHGILTMPSREALQKIAVALDKERAAGKVRSRLHGIPVILKVKCPILFIGLSKKLMPDILLLIRTISIRIPSLT